MRSLIGISKKILLIILPLMILGCIDLGVFNVFKSSIWKYGPEEVDNFNFTGFTYVPVNLEEVFSGVGVTETGISSFFSYRFSSHPEGPRKWYIAGSTSVYSKAYLPAKCLLRKEDVQLSGSEDYIYGNKVQWDASIWILVSPSVTVFYTHLHLLDSVLEQVNNSEKGYYVYDAGTHIGYSDLNMALDFGVIDITKPSGMTRDPYNSEENSWNCRANPLDYFTDSVKQEILDAYAVRYAQLEAGGTTPFSDLEESRSNVNIKDTIWGVWWLDALESPGDTSDVYWAIMSFTKRSWLSSETYWQVLNSDTALDGVYCDSNPSGGSVASGVSALYEGGPFGFGKIYLLSGTETAGVAKVVDSSDVNKYAYLKFEVQTANKIYNEKLKMQEFSTQAAAESGSFTSSAVTFRRDPTRY